MRPATNTETEGTLPLGEAAGASAAPTRPSGQSRRQRGRRAPAAPQVDAGTELEMRLARVMFWEGSYARRGIDLERHFHPEPVTVTDLDLLAYAFTPQLRLIKTIGEAKTGTSKNAPKPLDRAIWLAGLMPLVGAESAELVTALAPTVRVRELAAQLRVRAMTLDDLARREAAADVASVADLGAHGPSALRRVLEVQRAVKGDREPERAFWFLRSEVWFLEPWAAVKRTIGLLRLLSTWWRNAESGDQPTLRWLSAEALSVFVLSLVTVAEGARYREQAQWQDWVKARLAEGAVPMHHMRALSDSVDTFVGKLLAEVNAAPQVQVEAMGAFIPQPPAWADALIDLTNRLAQMPALATLPRNVDFVVHERLVWRRHADTAAVARVSGGSIAELSHARRLVAAFLRGAAGLADTLDRALTATETLGPSSGAMPEGLVP